MSGRCKFRYSKVVPHRLFLLGFYAYISRMFVKQIKKKNKNSDKQYVYYRLVHTYKIGNKVRHQNILSLGEPRNTAQGTAQGPCRPDRGTCHGQRSYFIFQGAGL
jgi:hypothetical protein